MKKIFLLSLILILLLPIVNALDINKVNTMTLLSVAELENGSYVGKTAQLILQVKPGHGSVFIDSYPLSKIDTQLSTKIANEIACSISKFDCENYNFFYTIKADSAIVGGPSAGGAITLLTLATLEDIPINENIAMTGMISSGGIILPVDGIKEKVEAAKNLNLIILPEFAFTNNSLIFEEEFKTQLNSTINETDELYEEILNKNDFKKYSNIYYVKTISEAFEKISGIKSEDKKEIQIPEFYIETMKKTSEILCEKTIESLNQIENKEDELYVLAQESYEKSLNSSLKEQYYSTASFCYSANLRLRELQLKNLSQTLLNENLNSLNEKIEKFEKSISEYELLTFTDLEAYMIIQERLIESKDYLKNINSTNISYTDLAFAIERYQSAVAWSIFLGQEGVSLIIDEEHLRNACFRELQKSEMILSYLEAYIPDIYLSSIKEANQHAKYFSNQQNNVMCLYTASKARANGNYFMTIFGVPENKTKEIVVEKLNVVEEMISKQKNAFPIMGYSYLEYSRNLIDTQEETALLFSEYGLIFSDLSYYFPQQKNYSFAYDIKLLLFCVFLFFMGFITGFLVFKITSRKSKPKKRVPKKAN
ncbi:MAG: S16 family serine protease [Candidatus Woesearchaeota archaeon]